MAPITPHTELVTVRIPDLFVSFLAEPPRVNAHYKQVKPEAEAWISKVCSFDKRMSSRLSRGDFGYFMAICAPDAPRAKYRTLVDWNNWVFPFDDMFDDGELQDEPMAATMVLQSLMSPMIESRTTPGQTPPEEDRLPIIQVHDTVWQRIVEGSSSGVQTRFTKAMTDYCAGLVVQVEDVSERRPPSTPEELLKARQLSIGVTPLFALIEYAHGIELPDYVFEHAVIQEFVELGIEFCAITNDIMSYKKEEGQTIPHNLVAIARMRGLGAQEAFDYVGTMLESRYERWERAIVAIPDWGEEVNKHVRSYVKGIADVVRANLYWSFKTERYLGKDGATIRQSRCLQVLKSPGYLRNNALIS
ncbi:isoprenoid synthase domain-containing protein [Xylaria bambusicola]|uniref:isoprenoid synthase domain-containing protein n=1 Tax=Xylaria bambusicola TaxID=326684 RepID=UPI002008BB92|nr:isoprenoid synthase domain-containing protein [Xylaria bambusicola]KAI0520880.1 isoprenoid synthase domain-containing protein [Xylaria bambusicola]